MKINAVMLQTDPKPGALESNRLHVARMIEQSMKFSKKPDLILLPETWNSPYTFSGVHSLREQARQNAEPIDGASITLLCALAKKYSVWIGAGSITLQPEAHTDRYYNSTFLISRQGELVTRYDKIHLCAWAHENEVFSYGEGLSTPQTELGTLGMIICYDIRFGELSRIHALNGAQVLLVPACFSTSLAQWRQMIIARAVENQLFVLACGTCGENHVGHSLAVAPDGTILAEAGDEEEILTAELDLEQIRAIRGVVSYLEDRRPEIYGRYGLVK